MPFFSFKKLSFLVAISSMTLTSFSSVTSAQTANIQNTKRSYIPNELIIRVKDGAISTSSDTDFKMASLQNSSWLANLGVISTNPLFKSYKKQLQKLQRNKPTRLERYLKVKVSAGENIESLIERFKNDPNIEYVEPNYVYHKLTTTNDPKINDLWAFNNTGQTGGNVDSDIDLFEAWDIETGSTATIVAVIDTGVDYTHEDLAENIWINEGEIPDNGIDDDNNGYVDDVRGWDFAADDNNPIDEDTHGTHVSGTIGGVANNGIGVTGVAWNVRVMPIRFLGDGGGTAEAAFSAIKYAVDNGAKIINASWGGEGESEAIKEAIEYAEAAGVLFVAAAGNETKDNDSDSWLSSPNFPSSYDIPNILAVAASDDTDKLASFSNYGLTTVDVAAPGYHILSSVPGDDYDSYNGTSMATPVTAGLAALIFSQDPNLTAIEIKQRIMDTVDPIDDLQGKIVSGGRINAFTALNTNSKPVITTTATVDKYDVTVSGNINDADGFIASAEIEINGINIDYAQTVEISLDGSGDFSEQITDLNDDAYTIKISAIDDKGARSITTETVMVGEVPNTIPTISVSQAVSTQSGCISISGSANDPDSYGSISAVTIKILGIGNIDASIDSDGNWNAETCDLLNGQYTMFATATDNFGAKSLRSLEYIVEATSVNAATETLPNHVEAGRVQKYKYSWNQYIFTTEYENLREKYCTVESQSSYDCDGIEHEFTLYQCAGEITWAEDASACISTPAETDVAITSSDNLLELENGDESEYTLIIANNGSATTSAVYIESSELQLDCGAEDCINEEGEIQILNITPSQGTCEITNNSTFNCSLGNMEQATTATIRVQIIADKAGNVNTNIAVSSAQTDTDTADNNTLVAVQIKETAAEETDSDGDGVLDKDDAFPFDRNESADFDEDGTGDNADPDDDNDGVADIDDTFPLDPSESADFDEDGTGDNADLDDDNDETPDSEDAFPFDPSESKDSDGDGIGDNQDTDDDSGDDTGDDTGDDQGDDQYQGDGDVDTGEQDQGDDQDGDLDKDDTQGQDGGSGGGGSTGSALFALLGLGLLTRKRT